MKMFKMMMLAGLVALPLGAAAQAADADAPIAADPGMTGLYLRGDIGWSMLTWEGGDDDSTWLGSAGLGYRFNDNLRSDITADWSGDYDIGAGEISSHILMGNAYWDFANGSGFTPYVGAGVGYGWVNGSGGASDDSGLALGVTAGVTADITSNLAVDVGYHFKDIMLEGDDVMQHALTTGLRFSF